MQRPGETAKSAQRRHIKAATVRFWWADSWRDCCRNFRASPSGSQDKRNRRGAVDHELKAACAQPAAVKNKAGKAKGKVAAAGRAKCGQCNGRGRTDVPWERRIAVYATGPGDEEV